MTSRPPSVVVSTEVKKNELHEYIEYLEGDTHRALDAELAQIDEQSPSFPHFHARKDFNKPKNRFQNIYPWPQAEHREGLLEDGDGKECTPSSCSPTSGRRAGGVQGEQKRMVKQYHFTAWPDFGAPKHVTDLLDFMADIRSTMPTNGDHLLVHCSAGVGRTGTFIGLWNLIDEADADTTTEYVNIKQTVMKMRKRRPIMVQSTTTTTSTTTVPSRTTTTLSMLILRANTTPYSKCYRLLQDPPLTTRGTERVVAFVVSVSSHYKSFHSLQDLPFTPRPTTGDMKNFFLVCKCVQVSPNVSSQQK
ncbi:Receptor-type tyrosine-protein phosphatase mu-like [Homarus americanus]|uniref:Receptor-type tyrosine-protein phosphatase mu-like n=1 Tax=Homarus americanus TaxID=6706 RepID=A0A8J5K4T0_HOMAM|nr:Receptor-type tyrosine-protein phosphatase mu-like [Homarus americanus]